MAGTTSVLKIHYHFESSGRKSSQDYIDYVASANDYTSIKTVLSNNSRLQGGTLVIDAAQNMPSGSSTVLS